MSSLSKEFAFENEKYDETFLGKPEKEKFRNEIWPKNIYGIPQEVNPLQLVTDKVLDVGDSVEFEYLDEKTGEWKMMQIDKDGKKKMISDYASGEVEIEGLERFREDSEKLLEEKKGLSQYSESSESSLEDWLHQHRYEKKKILDRKKRRKLYKIREGLEIGGKEGPPAMRDWERGKSLDLWSSRVVHYTLDNGTRGVPGSIVRGKPYKFAYV